MKGSEKQGVKREVDSKPGDKDKYDKKKQINGKDTHETETWLTRY